MTSLARCERTALADLLDRLGPQAPTLCGDWSTRDLAAHLVVRERRPDAALGVVLAPLARWTGQVQASYARQPYAALVERVRTGPGRLSPFALPGLDRLLNTTEYAVHHEDVRRAQPGWTPRNLARPVQDALWRAGTARATLALRGVPARVVLRRADQPGTETSHGTADVTATVTGEPMELLLYLFGRRQHAQVAVTGDPVAVHALAEHSLAV